MTLDLDQLTRIGEKAVGAMMHVHSRVFCGARRFHAELLSVGCRCMGGGIEPSGRLCRWEWVTDAMEAMGDCHRTALKDDAEKASARVCPGRSIASGNAGATVAAASHPGEGGQLELRSAASPTGEPWRVTIVSGAPSMAMAA
jgi:hypothetical protein